MLLTSDSHIDQLFGEVICSDFTSLITLIPSSLPNPPPAITERLVGYQIETGVSHVKNLSLLMDSSATLCVSLQL